MIQPFIIKGGFIGGHWALIKVGCKTAAKWVSGVGWVIFIGETGHCTYTCAKACL
jgi:hypothetical protein